MITFKKPEIKMWSRLGSCGAFGLAMDALAKEDEKLLVTTADLCFYSGLDRFKRNHPDQYYNLGIAEQNMIGVAAGLASEGYRVFATTYASFAAARCCDQVKVNMAYMKLPVKLVGLTAGLSVGILGPTHMSWGDLAVMRAMPDIAILSPADCTETVKATIAAAEYNGPVYVRLTGSMNSPIVYKEDYEYRMGKAIQMKEGLDAAVIATGSMVHPAAEAVLRLEQEGISCGLVNMHTIRPLDTEILEKIRTKYSFIITVEEHGVVGGLGSAVLEYLSDKNSPPIKRIGLEGSYPHAAGYEHLLGENGLTADGIYSSIKSFVRGIQDGV